MTRRAYTVNFKWNATVWIVTSSFILFFAVLAGTMLIYSFREHSATALVAFFVIAAIGAASILASEGYSPQYLEISDEGIVVVRRYADVDIDRSEIVSVERVAGSKIRRAICTGGSSGLFGFFGSYHARGIGGFEMYATRFDNLFLITTCRNKYVVSCAEPERLAHYLD